MQIAITGSSGLIGSALIPVLEQRGHAVSRVVRPTSHAKGIQWNPATGEIDLVGLEGHDAVVHLAGESIGGLWTQAKKRRIRESREQGTSLIATSFQKLQRPPGTLISASATGYYGDRPADERLTENSPSGAGFLAETTEAWEHAAKPAEAAGARVVNTRFGLVLSGKGGALRPVVPIFRAGLGGRLGSGRQIWSWVAIDDVVGAITFALETAALRGPVNVVAPLPVTNLAFTRTLGRVLRRPTVFSAPGFLLKAVGGQMAEELLLSGARVVPEKLKAADFDFQYPELEAALRHILKSGT